MLKAKVPYIQKLHTLEWDMLLRIVRALVIDHSPVITT
jgi:hypothetical protein